ncbi:MAG: phage holin family protein [Chromatiales bacterium]
MAQFLVHLVVTASLLLLVAHLVSGFEVKGWGSAFLGALVLGLVNGLVRPVMVLLTLPLTILTFGLFLLIVNALMFWLVAAFAPGIRIDGFRPAFVGSLLLSLLNIAVAMLVGPEWRTG